MEFDVSSSKAATDRKEYKLLCLPNGLRCLLVEEPSRSSSTNSAVALTVRVGSFADAPEVPGLAHFTEHLVFMGSERFPDENELSK
jgi:insulysin